ncbi:MobF family relaxase [Acidithiobacillus sp. HP-11]|uniref:MobF family relaxase n=1 Tax=Acidithiobacillus sp. HP-11 TaxID=2697656 RepID=UPI00187B09CB|nr:MobF family relaxase [Acidithiobacillus sp. HP-11]MBE7566831.1 relaxase domain-containing protein [Acidithiobacillus sp. HP-11]
MSVKESHLSGSATTIVKYVEEEKEAHRTKSGEEYTTGYYSENNKVQSMWIGKGAESQGLSGAVKSEDLEKLLSGTTMDGEDISKRGGHDKERRMGSDWTFSAPKAASIIGIEDERVKQWMLESTAEAIEEYYAKEMTYARLGKGGAISEFSENISAAAYLHETARAADGTIDPQLHVHCVVPNMVQRSDGEWVSLRADYGQNNSKVYTLGDVQVAKLMQKMQAAGYELETRLERDDKGIEHLSFGVKGISKEAEDAFSGRKKQINTYLENNGIDPKSATRAQKDAAALNTRADKDKNVDAVNLKYQQRQRARDAGLDLSGIRANADHREKNKNEQQNEKITGKDVVKSAIKHLAERDDVFSRSDLLAESIKAGAGSVDLKDIHKAIDDRTGGLIRAADVDRDGTGKNEQYFTTKSAVYREAEILQRAKDGQGKAEAIIETQHITRSQENRGVGDVNDVSFTVQEIEDGKRISSKQQTRNKISSLEKTSTLTGHRLRSLSERGLDAHEIGQSTGVLSDHAQPDRSGDHDLRRATDDERIAGILQKQEDKQGFKFSQGQREAVALALTTDARHAGVVGSSGAGKTTSMKIIVEQYREAGYQVIGVAPTAKAKRELESAGCDETITLASALLKKRDAEDTQKRIYITDESGMISSKDMDKFIRKVDNEQNARSFLVGDPYQIDAVEAGTPFAQLLETESIPYVKIDEVQRQRAAPELLKIAQAYARGDAETGSELVRPYVTQVKVEKGQDKDVELAKVAANRYLQMTPEQRENAYFITDTNKKRQEINGQIRDGLINEKALGEKAVNISALDKLDLTAEAATRSEKYTAGKQNPDAQVIVEFNREYMDKDTLVSAKKGTQWNVLETDGGKLTLQSRDNPDDLLKVNPAKINISAFTERNMELRDGDQVFFRKNDKERGVINGTSGTVVIDDKGQAAVKTDTGETVEIDQQKAEALDYNYAVTTHAVQGGTRKTSIPVFTAGGSVSAKLFYVAVTRETHELEVITDDTDKMLKQVSKYVEKESAMKAAKAKAPESLEEIQKARMAAGKEIGSVGDLAQVRASGNAQNAELPSQTQAAEKEADKMSGIAQNGDAHDSQNNSENETPEQKLQEQTEQQEQAQEPEMEMSS